MKNNDKNNIQDEKLKKLIIDDIASPLNVLVMSL